MLILQTINSHLKKYLSVLVLCLPTHPINCYYASSPQKLESLISASLRLTPNIEKKEIIFASSLSRWLAGRKVTDVCDMKGCGDVLPTKILLDWIVEKFCIACNFIKHQKGYFCECVMYVM